MTGTLADTRSAAVETFRHVLPAGMPDELLSRAAAGGTPLDQTLRELIACTGRLEDGGRRP